MKRVYLRIIDVDKFDLAAITEENEATHRLDVFEDDYPEVVSVLQKYLHRIQLNIPFDHSGELSEA